MRVVKRWFWVGLFTKYKMLMNQTSKFSKKQKKYLLENEKINKIYIECQKERERFDA